MKDSTYAWITIILSLLIFTGLMLFAWLNIMELVKEHNNTDWSVRQ